MDEGYRLAPGASAALAEIVDAGTAETAAAAARMLATKHRLLMLSEPSPCMSSPGMGACWGDLASCVCREIVTEFGFQRLGLL